MLLRCLDEARLRSREAPRCQAATASPSAPACDAHLGHRHERLSRSWIQTAWQWAPGHHDSTAACRAVLRQFHFPPPGSTAACGSAALGLPSHLALLLMFGGVKTAVIARCVQSCGPVRLHYNLQYFNSITTSRPRRSGLAPLPEAGAFARPSVAGRETSRPPCAESGFLSRLRTASKTSPSAVAAAPSSAPIAPARGGARTTSAYIRQPGGVHAGAARCGAVRGGAGRVRGGAGRVRTSCRYDSSCT